MSYWTHITACIYVDTWNPNEFTKDVAGYIKDVLKNAPDITGSEGPADIFVNALSGHSSSSWDHENDCYIEYQTRAAITIIGDLRDRLKEQTRDEYESFVRFLGQQGWEIRQRSCSIREY